MTWKPLRKCSTIKKLNHVYKERKYEDYNFTEKTCGYHAGYDGAGQQRDWANYGRYAAANAALTTAPAVVFMGNSITDGWDNAHPEFFTDNNFACRGIGGQVTSQMLCRFRADVIAVLEAPLSPLAKASIFAS